MTDTIIVIGFINSGKSSLYHNIKNDNIGLKVAYLFDGVGTLPESVLNESKGHKVLEQDIAIELQNGSIATVMEEEFIENFILKNGPFDKVVFFSHPFESTFLLEVLSCGEEMDGSLGKFITSLKLINVVCILDAETLLDDLKSNKKVGEMVKSIVGDQGDDIDQYDDDDQDEYEKELIENFEKQQIKQQQQQHSCCDEKGNCSGGKDNCSNKDDKEHHHHHDEEELNEGDDIDINNDLVKTTDKLVSTLILEQISISNIIILNKIDKIESKKLNFISKLLNLISSSYVIETSFCKIPNLNLLFNYVVTIRDYKLENETDVDSGITIINYYQRKPFHPIRLKNLIYDNKNNFKFNSNFNGVLLTTGLIWLANDMKNKYNFEIIEGKESIGNKRPFWSCMNESDWNPVIKENIEREIKLFKYQDRKIELSIVGIESENGFNKDKMISLLDQCLLTDKEMELGPNQWEVDFKCDYFLNLK